MTRSEFVQQAAISQRANGAGAKEAWTTATDLADAAPAGTFDQAAQSAPKASGGGAGTFPPFGQSKGEPIHGASEKTLRFYAGAALRSLSDPSKERFHDKERASLAAYVNELERQGKDASEFAQRKDDGRRAPPMADPLESDLPPF